MNNRERPIFQERPWPQMVEVFKTNVQEISQANRLLALLHQHFPGSKITFDLEDCDKILRVEGMDFVPVQVKQLVEAHGFFCWDLE